MTPVYDFPAETIAFVERGLWGGRRRFGPATAIGFATADEGLVAGFIYHNFEPDTGVIEVSGYSTRRNWCTKPRLARIFDYPFAQLKCRLVVARHSEHNIRVRRIWAALGATEYLIPELRGEGEAEALAVLHRDVWNRSKFKG